MRSLLLVLALAAAFGRPSDASAQWISDRFPDGLPQRITEEVANRRDPSLDGLAAGALVGGFAGFLLGTAACSALSNPPHSCDNGIGFAVLGFAIGALVGFMTSDAEPAPRRPTDIPCQEEERCARR